MFKLQMAKYAHKDKMIKVVRIQRFWRRRGEMIITSRAKEFLEKAKNGVLNYKKVVDKEKMELEAKNRIVRAFKRNLVKQRLMRYSINCKIVLDVVNDAWEGIRENIERRNSLTIQRIFKGYIERLQTQHAIQSAKEVRYQCASTKSLRIIQK